VTTPEAEHSESDRTQAEDARPQGAGDADAHDESAPEAAPEAQARPEERLERAVRAAEQALIEFEIAVETFRVEVENFSRLHHQKLGPMYSRLDELDAQIAEAVAARTGDVEDIRKADEARARVMPMPGVEELFHGWMDSEGLFPEAVAMLTDQPYAPATRPVSSTVSWSARPTPTWHRTTPSAGGATSSSPGSTPRTAVATSPSCGSCPRSGRRARCPRSGSRVAARSSTPASSGSPSARNC
jgi:hypothetical protein